MRWKIQTQRPHIIYISSNYMIQLDTGHKRQSIHCCVTTIIHTYTNLSRNQGKNVEFSSMNRKCMCSVHKPVYVMDGY